MFIHIFRVLIMIYLGVLYIITFNYYFNFDVIISNFNQITSFFYLKVKILDDYFQFFIKNFVKIIFNYSAELKYLIFLIKLMKISFKKIRFFVSLA